MSRTETWKKNKNDFNSKSTNICKQFRKVRAKFIPKERHSLKNEYVPFIGKEFVFQYLYIMDEDDMYPGIMALRPLYNEEGFDVGWVPEFDLEIIEEVL